MKILLNERNITRVQKEGGENATLIESMRGVLKEARTDIENIQKHAITGAEHVQIQVDMVDTKAIRREADINQEALKLASKGF